MANHGNDIWRRKEKAEDRIIARIDNERKLRVIADQDCRSTLATIFEIIKAEQPEVAKLITESFGV